MANANSKRQNSLVKKVFIILAFVVVSMLYCGVNGAFEDFDDPIGYDTSLDGELQIVMIDVKQADCFLLKQGEHAALIDCGITGKDAVKFLQNAKISKLDYVIGTHPHNDHMGGMYDVITNFDVGEVIIPKVTKNKPTTNWYAKLMKELYTGGYKVVNPQVGDVFSVGDATLTVIVPSHEPDSNLNNYSIVLKVSYGEMDALMTGDAEKDVEKEILKSGRDIDVEILKVGHHGSDTSSCDEFLDEVSPDYALISTAVNNKHNHPVKSTMDKFKERKVKVYRTDECGNVIVTITSSTISFSTKPGDYLSGPELAEKVGK